MDVRSIDTRYFKIIILSKEVNTNISTDIIGRKGVAMYCEKSSRPHNELIVRPLVYNFITLDVFFCITKLRSPLQ